MIWHEKLGKYDLKGADSAYKSIKSNSNSGAFFSEDIYITIHYKIGTRDFLMGEINSTKMKWNIV